MKETNNHSPYFSLILPIYNVASYLEDCIRSVLKQDFTDYEVILVDDGSTDESGNLCDFYAEKYPNIQVIHKENGGLSSARNAGTAAATGRYIWWVDSDDWIEPGALQTLYDATEDGAAEIVKFNFYRVGAEKISVICAAEPGTYEQMGLVDMCFLLPGRFSLSAWGHVYKRTFLTEHPFAFVSEREIGSEDYLFNLTAFAAAKKVRVIPEHLYSYRLREGSLTQRYRECLPQKYTELYRQLCRHYDRMGLRENFEGYICRFYVWHLLHGTCFGNEYRETEKHSREDGRRNVRRFLKMSEVRYAAKHCTTAGFTNKQKLQLLAMRLGFEPLFYRLFVRKPQLKKDKHHED